VRLGAICVLAAVAAGPAAAQDIGVWTAAGLHGPYARDRLSTPSDADVMAAWPAAAAARKLPGNALAACKADIAGKLSGCRLMVERPSNAGFGEALLALAPRYRLRYAAEGARPPQADVLISASWPVPDTAPDWLVAPKDGDFSTSSTDAAWRHDGPELSVMNCLLGKLGTLYQCVVVYQDPPGIGLGEMSLRFAAYLRFKPAILGGKPVPVGLTIPFNWKAERRFPPVK
jgi:hypothetical protein